eukprot:UN21911
MNGLYSRFQLRRAFSKKSRQESLGLNFLLHALLVGIFALLSRHSQQYPEPTDLFYVQPQNFNLDLK